VLSLVKDTNHRSRRGRKRRCPVYMLIKYLLYAVWRWLIQWTTVRTCSVCQSFIKGKKTHSDNAAAIHRERYETVRETKWYFIFMIPCIVTTFRHCGLIRPSWRKVVAQILWPVSEAAVTVWCTPDDGCDRHPKYVE